MEYFEILNGRWFFTRARGAATRPAAAVTSWRQVECDITISTSISEAEFGLTMTDGIAIADAVGDGVPALS